MWCGSFLLQPVLTSSCACCLPRSQPYFACRPTLGAVGGGGGRVSINDALWVCQNMFSEVKVRTAGRRVLLFTNEDEPHAASKKSTAALNPPLLTCARGAMVALHSNASRQRCFPETIAGFFFSRDGALTHFRALAGDDVQSSCYDQRRTMLPKSRP